MSDQTSEFHVAQQSRRERLRFNSEQGIQPYQYGNISYDPSVMSTEMFNFGTSTEPVVVSNKDSMMMHNLELRAASDRLDHRISHDVTQNCSNWKSIDLQQTGNCNWNNVGNYSSGSGVVTESNLRTPMFVGDQGLSGSLNLNNVSTMDVKPNFFDYQEIQQSPVTNSSSNMQYSSTAVLYHDTLQQVVTSATVGTRGVEMPGCGAWTESGNELLLLPNYVDHSRPLHVRNSSDLVSRPVERCHQWISCELGTNVSTNSTAPDNSNAQALALSLSPVPTSKTNMVQMEKRSSLSENFAIAHRSAVPLGPFTGYATILKSSKFLRPAQQLMDELCNLAAGSNTVKSCIYSKKVREGGVRVSCDGNAAESSSGAVVGDSGGSSAESNGRPDYLQKKAKLIYMQDEICRRYKQYHQQMQMVVSSFETVAGLSAATPYISLALKSISQHFRSLRNAISDHLKNIRQALGEDLPSPASGMSKGDGTSSKMKFVDQSLHKQKAGGAGVAFFESQQHVWRPQRGLPERAVAILRAWLFDHFLHPYPTDSDKHMLATQTGLTRNQVSNWFINARVRVWKPMVEEIHTLETKGLGDQTGSSVRRSDGKLVTERPNHVNDGLNRNSISISNCGQHFNVLNMSGMSEKQDDCSGIGPSERLDEDILWKNQEKRSRLECHIPASMDGSLMGFVPYQRNGLEIGGIGAVSLTLGLRQNAEAALQQQQLQQLHEHRLRQQFGGQMIHDFVD
ncbi:uncharacterized protein LOC107768451 [Nicotiana tabacum]|uniref:BEL1-like homeodomain protein 2 n=2 Tax=Nicotiana TaxID=4085 RepID=A0A1S3XT64_TOBAC|nr:PREDICTED: BEL1-like homeodomain protein 2 [Nicotiana sylvestris]XP_016443065.1 PREDICTED: BEL1-like homeodomain protein 2 [Nicotiana tabacum]